MIEMFQKYIVLYLNQIKANNFLNSKVFFFLKYYILLTFAFFFYFILKKKVDKIFIMKKKEYSTLFIKIFFLSKYMVTYFQIPIIK